MEGAGDVTDGPPAMDGSGQQQLQHTQPQRQPAVQPPTLSFQPHNLAPPVLRVPDSVGFIPNPIQLSQLARQGHGVYYGAADGGRSTMNMPMNMPGSMSSWTAGVFPNSGANSLKDAVAAASGEFAGVPSTFSVRDVSHLDGRTQGTASYVLQDSIDYHQLRSAVPGAQAYPANIPISPKEYQLASPVAEIFSAIENRGDQKKSAEDEQRLARMLGVLDAALPARKKRDRPPKNRPPADPGHEQARLGASPADSKRHSESIG